MAAADIQKPESTQTLQTSTKADHTKCQTPLHGHRLRTVVQEQVVDLLSSSVGGVVLYNTTNGHHQGTSSQQVVDVVQHVRSRLNLFYNILPATDITNGRAHNNSTTCCTTNSPLTGKNWPHPNILTCRDVGLLHCDVANLL